MAVFTPSVRVEFDEPGTSQKFNQAAENTDWAKERVDALQASVSALVPTVTGTVTVTAGSSGAYGPYITHDRGTKYPTVTLVSTDNPALGSVVLEWGIEFTDTGRLRLFLINTNGTITRTVRYIIR